VAGSRARARHGRQGCGRRSVRFLGLLRTPCVSGQNELIEGEPPGEAGMGGQTGEGFLSRMERSVSIVIPIRQRRGDWGGNLPRLAVSSTSSSRSGRGISPGGELAAPMAPRRWLARCVAVGPLSRAIHSHRGRTMARPSRPAYGRPPPNGFLVDVEQWGIAVHSLRPAEPPYLRSSLGLEARRPHDLRPNALSSAAELGLNALKQIDLWGSPAPTPMVRSCPPEG